MSDSWAGIVSGGSIAIFAFFLAAFWDIYRDHRRNKAQRNAAFAVLIDAAICSERKLHGNAESLQEELAHLHNPDQVQSGISGLCATSIDPIDRRPFQSFVAAWASVDALDSVLLQRVLRLLSAIDETNMRISRREYACAGPTTHDLYMRALESIDTGLLERVLITIGLLNNVLDEVDPDKRWVALQAPVAPCQLSSDT